MTNRKEVEIGGRKLIIETGWFANQAHGAVMVQYEDTVVMVTAVASQDKIENPGFIPLMVEYREKAYASGRIPGGFFKREGRPSDKEVLSSRLIDRPVRPLCSKEFPYEIQIIASLLSSDCETNGDVLGILGASSALMISDIPFGGPIGAVRVGRIDGEFVVNPTYSELENSDMDIIIVGTENDIVMVEGETKEVSEEDMVKALQFGFEEIKKIIPFQYELRELCGKEKRPYEKAEIDEGFISKVTEASTDKLKEILLIKDKAERKKLKKELYEVLNADFAEIYEDTENNLSEYHLKNIVGDIERTEMRKRIIDENIRIDGRGLDDIRDISCKTDLLPRTHGSAVFTRGQTQALCVITLGTKSDEQKIEAVHGDFSKSFMLHYNFPPFSVGEVRFLRGPGRREVGHGYLAERAFKPVLPEEENFPYTIRLVSDILESNGSSSMATVCASSLSLMDAGVPIRDAVGGIAMGLIKERDKVSILSDILGDEDHIGDMDFKVTGTKEGITAFQMDVKCEGISFEVLREVLQQAKDGRLHILDIMNETISKPREELSQYAPKIIVFKIDKMNIGTIIGSGGKVIREIQEKTGVTISIEEDGTIFISAPDTESGNKAKDIIDGLLEEPEPGKIYKGTVKKIAQFGAFVEILPGKEGLLHISEIENRRIERVEDVLKVGDEVEVKLLRMEQQGKMVLSRKVLLK